ARLEPRGFVVRRPDALARFRGGRRVVAGDEVLALGEVPQAADRVDFVEDRPLAAAVGPAAADVAAKMLLVDAGETDLGVEGHEVFQRQAVPIQRARGDAGGPPLGGRGATGERLLPS